MNGMNFEEWQALMRAQRNGGTSSEIFNEAKVYGEKSFNEPYIIDQDNVVFPRHTKIVTKWLGYIAFHTDGNGDDVPASDAYILGYMCDGIVYAVYDTDGSDYYSCAAKQELYWEEHLSNWIADGNVDAVKSSFLDWIAINQIDPALEVKNEIVAQVTIQGYLPVIEPEGVAQVFASADCRRYATGVVDSVYVRLNRSFGFNDIVSYGEVSQHSEYLRVYTPTTEYPDDCYSVECWGDFINEGNNGYTAGQIVLCHSIQSMDVTNFKKVFP